MSSLNLSEIINSLKCFELPKEQHILEITNKVREILLEEPNVVRINSPVTVF
jgi:hypothetical protein